MPQHKTLINDDDRLNAAVKELLNSEENTPSPIFTISRAFSILLQFQMIPCDLLSDAKESAQQKIEHHLLDFSSKNSTASISKPAKSIVDICEKASDLLAPSASKIRPKDARDSDLSLEKKDILPRTVEYQFQPKWLTNIGILLPATSEVTAILPYLLTCYTYNVPANHLDPFNDSPGTGWMELFQEIADTSVKLQIKDGIENRKRNAASLARKFTVPFKSIGSSFFFSGSRYLFDSNVYPSDDLYACKLPRDNLKKSDWKKIIDEKRACMECWELYRRFVAFCNACSNDNTVNLPLSMALFTSIFDIGQDNDIQSHSEKYLDDFGHQLYQYSWDDIQRPYLRNLILDLSEKYTPDELENETDIYEISYLTRIDFQKSLELCPFW